MARTKGMLNLSGNLEVNAGAPLDARTVVPTAADLLVASNFQYKYIGMTVVVQATGDMYILTANDVTVAANWKQVGSGGGGSSYTAGEGIVIEDDEISTDNMPAADMSEIVTPLPSVSSNMPVLYDKTGAERQVGWYKNSEGLKKPIYEKSLVGTIDNTGMNSIPLNFSITINVMDVKGICHSSDDLQIPSGFDDGVNCFTVYYWNDAVYFGARGTAVLEKSCEINIRYTKSTDTFR